MGIPTQKGDKNEIDVDGRTGGRYDPVLDRWIPTAIAESPTERVRHSAVWTGSELIVWGGARCCAPGTFYKDDGGRYDPATNSWTLTSVEGAPLERDNHTAVWTGSEMIVWGGWHPGFRCNCYRGLNHQLREEWADTRQRRDPY